MNTESDTFSGWFVSNAGKVYAKCPACHSSQISYHKTRKAGLKGISAFSKGLTPACLDCGKNMPTLNQRAPKVKQKKSNSLREMC